MKLSKGKLPKIIGQKSQTMKKKKHRGGSQNNKTFRKKHKPLNLHRSSVKKIHVGGVTYDVIDDSEGGASKSKDKKKHMPPKGGKQLTREEINLVSNWIKNGSSFKKSVEEFKLDENLINYFFMIEKPFYPTENVSMPISSTPMMFAIVADTTSQM